MKKASATVLYNKNTNQIYNLTIHYKGDFITHIHYKPNDKAQPYKYDCFDDLYKSVLKIAKNNGYYFASYNQFNAIWYDIGFIDIANPYEIAKRYIKEV